MPCGDARVACVLRVTIVIFCSEGFRECFNVRYGDNDGMLHPRSASLPFNCDSNVSQLTRIKSTIVGNLGGVSISCCSVALRIRGFRKW